MVDQVLLLQLDLLLLNDPPLLWVAFLYLLFFVFVPSFFSVLVPSSLFALVFACLHLHGLSALDALLVDGYLTSHLGQDLPVLILGVVVCC